MSTATACLALLFLFTLLAACGNNPSNSPASADAQALQGDWQVTQLDLGMPDVPPATPKNMILRFANDKFLIVGTGNDANPSTFSLDPTSNPKIFRSFPPLNTGVAPSLGTYELNGDTLRLAITPTTRDPFDANLRSMTITAIRKR